ncbi:MAG: WYL domain-containing protein, partial [Acidimicrobiia bacterium]|nr:WYL domain-containing protein [Acidimicrobiia bacterium]
MIPWLAGRDGPTVEEVLTRFGLTRRQLDEDLDLLMVVGVPPYTPDELFEMTIEDGRVFARLTPSFDRPLRLSPDEALAVVVAGRAVADVPGADPAGPLARALTKVAGVLGVEGDDVLDIDLGPVAEP